MQKVVSRRGRGGDDDSIAGSTGRQQQRGQTNPLASSQRGRRSRWGVVGGWVDDCCLRVCDCED